jgi:hypothetical protein
MQASGGAGDAQSIRSYSAQVPSSVRWRMPSLLSLLCTTHPRPSGCDWGSPHRALGCAWTCAPSGTSCTSAASLPLRGPALMPAGGLFGPQGCRRRAAKHARKASTPARERATRWTEPAAASVSPCKAAHLPTGPTGCPSLRAKLPGCRGLVRRQGTCWLAGQQLRRQRSIGCSALGRHQLPPQLLAGQGLLMSTPGQQYPSVLAAQAPSGGSRGSPGTPRVSPEGACAAKTDGRVGGGAGGLGPAAGRRGWDGYRGSDMAICGSQRRAAARVFARCLASVSQRRSALGSGPQPRNLPAGKPPAVPLALIQ